MLLKHIEKFVQFIVMILYQKEQPKDGSVDFVLEISILQMLLELVDQSQKNFQK
jgi:hypothetical protein